MTPRLPPDVEPPEEGGRPATKWEVTKIIGTGLLIAVAMLAGGLLTAWVLAQIAEAAAVAAAPLTAFM